MKMINKKRLGKLKFLWHERFYERKMENVILKNEKYITTGFVKKEIKKIFSKRLDK